MFVASLLFASNFAFGRCAASARCQQIAWSGANAPDTPGGEATHNQRERIWRDPGPIELNNGWCD
jgi:hypothetical protein